MRFNSQLQRGIFHLSKQTRYLLATFVLGIPPAVSPPKPIDVLVQGQPVSTTRALLEPVRTSQSHRPSVLHLVQQPKEDTSFCCRVPSINTTRFPTVHPYSRLTCEAIRAIWLRHLRGRIAETGLRGYDSSSCLPVDINYAYSIPVFPSENPHGPKARRTNGFLRSKWIWSKWDLTLNVLQPSRPHPGSPSRLITPYPY